METYSSSTDGSESIAMISWMSYLADPPRPLSHQFTWHGQICMVFSFLKLHRVFWARGVWGVGVYRYVACDFPGYYKTKSCKTVNQVLFLIHCFKLTIKTLGRCQFSIQAWSRYAFLLYPIFCRFCKTLSVCLSMTSGKHSWHGKLCIVNSKAKLWIQDVHSWFRRCWDYWPMREDHSMLYIKAYIFSLACFSCRGSLWHQIWHARFPDQAGYASFTFEYSNQFGRKVFFYSSCLDRSYYINALVLMLFCFYSNDLQRGLYGECFT